MQEVLEGKADDSNKATATEEELMMLQKSKADRAELDKLITDFKRIESIVDQLDGDYSGDSYDEYDDEDSQVEDVISLGDNGSQDKDEDDDEEFFEGDEDDPAKKLADKAKELTSKNVIAGTGFEPTKKLGDFEAKAEELKAKLEDEEKKNGNEDAGNEGSKAQTRKASLDNNDLKQDLHKDGSPVNKKAEATIEKSVDDTTHVD